MGIVRLALALFVAIDHWRVVIGKPSGVELGDLIKLGWNAGYAVMFFYVISGFLITYTLKANYSRDIDGALDFYRRRFIRLFSLYWPLVLAAFLFTPGTWRLFWDADLLAKLSGLFLIGMDWQLALRPEGTTIVIHGLSQAWTLGAEITFYLLAPLLLRSWRVAVVLLLASLGFRFGFLLLKGGPELQIWTYEFAPSTFCFFMMGHLACLAARRWPQITSAWLSNVLLIASVAAMALGDYWRWSYLLGSDSWRFWLSILCFTAALPGLFGQTSRYSWMNALGDLSYPVYLVHVLMLIAFYDALCDLARAWSGYGSLATFLAIALLAGLVAHRLCEVPISATMRRILRVRRRTATTAFVTTNS